MSDDHLNDLRDTARALLKDHRPTDSAAPDPEDTSAWNALEELGFTSLTVPEEFGGSGGDLRAAATVVRAAADVPGPVAEAAFLAGPALTAAGLDLPAGPVTATLGTDVTCEREGDRLLLRGTLTRVPWLRVCGYVAVVHHHDGADRVTVLPTGHLDIEPGVNLAGEARDGAVLARAEPRASAALPQGWADRFRLLGAAARASQIAAATATLLDDTLRHAGERVQFGRPLSRFQAVQHQIARLAADAVTADVAADTAVLALTTEHTAAELAVATAKAEASALAGRAAAIAHQVHGALGYTQEHRLGARTRRLWSWREEFGNEHHWWDRVGRLTEGIAPWELVTANEHRTRT
ncbi:acyl-CoA dehydrogenase family protein [Nocardiopsis dassonvillei]|uniref:acyl-CoA dehydrogenase family protein n=1 Tax=Nocardiopsis dassonvillei TaxID=2014 RepID=UPI003672C090